MLLHLAYTVNQLLVDRTDHTTPPNYELPAELWSLVFHQLTCKRDLLVLFATCRRFNALVLPFIVQRGGKTTQTEYYSGHWTIEPDIIPLLSHAVELPQVRRITCSYDAHSGATPYLLHALECFTINRATTVEELKLTFRGDLLSAYKTIIPLTPHRSLTTAFCELVSSFGGGSDSPVVLVGTEVFSSSAKDIRYWQLHKYIFNPPGTHGFLAGLQTFADRFIPITTIKSPLRHRIPLRHHNGVVALVSPLISISSVHMRRVIGPFSPKFPSPWTLVLLNAGSVHWPNMLRLLAPLDSEEWDVVLPQLQFEMLPVVRMDANLISGENGKRISAPALDAFLARHPTLTRIFYQPDERTFNGHSISFTLPRLRQLTTTARGACRLLGQKDVLPKLLVLRLTGVTEFSEMLRVLQLWKQQDGRHKVNLEVSAGPWINGFFDNPMAQNLLRSLDRMDMIVLSGATGPVQPELIIHWLELFPHLRRVALQDCLSRFTVDGHELDDEAWKEMKLAFSIRAKGILGERDGLDAMIAV